MKKLIISVMILSILLLFLNASDYNKYFPDNFKEIKKPIPYEIMVDFLKNAGKNEHIDVSIQGKTKENRALYLVHLFNRNKKKNWKVFFYAQQHGNEPAGKDAILFLIKQIAENRSMLDENIDLWLMPMVNPDGAVRNQRRNSNDADLNRDHLILNQPETRVIHKVFRRIMPHVAIDCHEFSRDSKSYLEKGWTEWPLIMMDCSNNPFFNLDVYKIGVEWCRKVSPVLNNIGFNYTRYYVGGVPVVEEQRHSTLEIDDGRNSLGAYNGLSFIIESGKKYRVKNPNEDLYKRIGAYLKIFWQFLDYKSGFQKYIDIIEKARNSKVPEFIPTNYFWGNKGNIITEFKVIDKKTGKTKIIETPNFMHHRIIKNSVKTPKGYIIEAKKSKSFKIILNRHNIPYKILKNERKYFVESCELLRIEDEFDEVYKRYSGRQIVRVKERNLKKFEKGAVFITVDKKNGVRTSLILEPLKLYGLFEYEVFNKLVSDDKIFPVYRVVDSKCIELYDRNLEY